MAAAPPADKANALITNITAAVRADLDADLKKIAEQLAKVLVSENAILARLEMIETASGSGAAPKRGVRASPAKAGAAGKKATPKKSGDEKSRVTNGLLYFRYAMAHDLDDYRATYGTPENVAEAENDPSVQKKDVNKNPEDYWSTVGNVLWKSLLSDDDKDAIRTQYNSWKEQGAREDAEDPLEADDA